MEFLQLLFSYKNSRIWRKTERDNKINIQETTKSINNRKNIFPLQGFSPMDQMKPCVLLKAKSFERPFKTNLFQWIHTLNLCWFMSLYYTHLMITRSLGLYYISAGRNGKKKTSFFNGEKYVVRNQEIGFQKRTP